MSDFHNDDERETDAEPPSAAAIDVEVTGGDDVIVRDLRSAVSFAANRHHCLRVQLEIAIVDAAQMSAFHQQWMDDPSATDVLTFDLRDDRQDTSRIEGQIIICEAVAREQALARDHHWHDEVLLYAIHGLLHLIGFDDHCAADFDRMHAEEDAIFAALGKPPIFKRSRSLHQHGDEDEI